MSFSQSMFESADVSRLGWTLVHSLWQGAAIAALLAVVLFALRRNSSQSRYASSCAAMALLLFIPIMTFLVLRPTPSPAESSSSIVATRSVPFGSVATPRSKAMKVDHAANTTVQLGRVTPEMRQADANPPVDLASAVATPPAVKLRAQQILPWLVAIWAVGVAAMSFWNLGGWMVLQRLKVAETKPAPLGVQQRLAQLCVRLDVYRLVRVLESARVQSPLVIGAFRPVMLLPASVICELPVAQLESILAHELAHIRRHDYVANLIQSVIETLLFYHPATWWIGRKIRAERENCCDDVAVSVTRNRSAYAQALTAVAAGRSPAMALAANGGVLLSRVRRVLGMPDPESPRPGGLVAGALGLAACLIFATLVAAPRLTKAQNTQPAARSLRVTFIDPTTGKPAASVTGTYWLDRQTMDNIKKYETDSTGQLLIALESQTQSVEFFYKKEGFVEGAQKFGKDIDSTGPIPASFDFHLQKGTTIGGAVVDESAKPVSGADVQLSFNVADPTAPGGLRARYGYVKTNAAGHWTLNGAPPDPSRISVFTRHPDVVMSSMQHEYGVGDWEALRTQRVVSAVHLGVVIAGTVTDEQNRPLPNAEVTPTQFGLINATKGDADGQFQLHGVERGSQKLVARAPGYAPEVVEVDAKPDMPRVNFRLSKGRVLRGRVVDDKGKPAPDARVHVENWRSIQRLGVYMTADSEGRFKWEGAPSDPFTLVASTQGFSQEGKLVTASGANDVVVTLPSSVTLQGNVVFDDTGKAVPSFRISVWGESRPYSFSMDRVGSDGSYEIAALQKAQWYTVRINAPGYIPSESDHLTATDNAIRFDARLSKTSGLSGTVMTDDGKPAAGADVLVLDRMGAAMKNGIVEASLRAEQYATKSDSAGKFFIPSRKGNVRIFAVHDSGWALLDKPADSLEGIKLRPWCTIEGDTVSTGKPLANQTVWLEPTPIRDVNAPNVWGFQYSTQTDEHGHFKLTRVADAEWNIGLKYTMKESDGRLSYRQSERRLIALKPGDHKTNVQIGGIGRMLVGKVLVSPKLKEHGERPTFGTLSLPQPTLVPPPGWENFAKEQKKAARDAFESGSAMQAYNTRVHEYVFNVNEDGSFMIEDVEAGEFRVTIDVQKPTPAEPNNYHWVSLGQKVINVPELGNAKRGDAMDIGTVQMVDFDHPKPGDVAPDFTVKSLDGRPLKLSDYGGKLVLLDFWATWCPPCVAEIPTLKAV